MYDKYFAKMFEEFKRVYGIEDSYDHFNKYQDLFVEWIAEKNYAANNYVKLFDYMYKNKNNNYIIAEFGKGIFDTITIEMKKNTNYRPVVISPFAKTIKDDKGIQTFTGKLIVDGNNARVKYSNEEGYYNNPNCYPKAKNEIGTLLLQAPYSQDEIEPFIKLSNSDKTLFIGTYGLIEDKNAKENLKRIENLYFNLSNISSQNIGFYSDTKNNSYLAAIKISPKQKKKSFINKIKF